MLKRASHLRQFNLIRVPQLTSLLHEVQGTHILNLIHYKVVMKHGERSRPVWEARIFMSPFYIHEA